jgi:two-component system, cell cycle sensor histidine kinase and response regulator CckA
MAKKVPVGGGGPGPDHDDLRFCPGDMPPLSGEGASVLIVDDDAKLTGVLERLLRSEGYECTLAANGVEARARLSERDFAVAFVDINIPGESGLELVDDLLGKDPDLAVVMVTGVDNPRVVELALQSAAYGYLVKPFLPSQVLITVANAGRRRYLEIERRTQHARLKRLLAARPAESGDTLGPLDKAAKEEGTAAPASAEKFRASLEAAPDAIVAADHDGRIVLANARTERLFGYGRDELLGQPVELLVPEQLPGSHPELNGQDPADPRSRPMSAGVELAGRRKDGTEFPAEISLSAVDTADGMMVSAAIRDVSDRKRAEAKFLGLLEAAPVAIVGVDRDGRIALVNPQVERLFGYCRDDLMGQPVEMLLPNEAPGVHPAWRASYFTDPKPRPMNAELSGRRKDGSEFPAEISLSTLETDDGPLVSAAIRDLSDRRQAAEAQAWLASIVQSSHDAIIGRALDGIITSWNPGAERLYGYTAEEIIGLSIDLLVPAHLGQEERDIFSQITLGERVEQYKTERLRKDGAILKVSLTVSPITEPSGTIVGLASVSRDISERERAEAKLRGVLNAAPDAIVGVDREGRIALVNAQAERLFGYPRDELLGQQVELLVPEHARAAHAEHRSRYVGDSERRPMGSGMELSARRKDGTEFPAEISLSAVETDEGLLISAAVRDISERIQAQAERENLKAQAERDWLERQHHQSQRLESLGQLAGGVAHDFNNLLAVILNYASFIGEEVARAATGEDGERWEAVRKDVEQVRRAAERATQLTHQLLAFGRREVVQAKVLNLNDVVTDVEQLLRGSIGEHVELATSLNPDLWSVLADPGQIEQVLVNLAVNARDAMPQGGTLTIDTENITVDDDYAALRPDVVPGCYVRLRVSDTGTGMDKAVLDRVFEPFFSTKSKGKGSGLGLATVYGIITQAGGRTQIYSEPGFGTTVTALLPVTDHEPLRIERTAEEPRTHGGETILIVEDEEAMREVTRRILTRNGHNVLVASGGSEAVALATQHPGDIDLIVTDVVMPQMLGKEVANQVQAVRPRIRVLYMSGYAQPVLASQGTLEEGVTLVEKPFSELQLLAKVREVLDAE